MSAYQHHHSLEEPVKEKLTHVHLLSVHKTEPKNAYNEHRFDHFFGDDTLVSHMTKKGVLFYSACDLNDITGDNLLVIVKEALGKNYISKITCLGCRLIVEIDL